MQRAEVRDTLEAIRRNEPVIWGMLVGYGSPLNIAGAAGITIRLAREHIGRLEDAGVIRWMYGTILIFNQKHEDGLMYAEFKREVKEAKLNEK